jgi:hypothetical protein
MATAERPATLDDLYRTEGKAELIDGRIVMDMASGVRPSEVASNIYVSLRRQVCSTKKGRAFNDKLGYVVPQLPSGRESFNADASYYDGPLPTNLMRFIQGPPTFAAEVRSEFYYGATADAEYAAKRADYFAAGTLVVWTWTLSPRPSPVTGTMTRPTRRCSGAAKKRMLNRWCPAGGLRLMRCLRDWRTARPGCCPQGWIFLSLNNTTPAPLADSNNSGRFPFGLSDWQISRWSP